MLKIPLEECFTSNIGICVKDLDRKVLYQNGITKENCGNRISLRCGIKCLKSYNENSKFPGLSEGVHLTKVQNDAGELFDAIVINDGEKILTLLHPLNKKIERSLEYAKKYGLSKRENEILLKVLRGRTNAEISKKLCISELTVKTHLNNIYKKLPTAFSNELKARGIRKDN